MMSELEVAAALDGDAGALRKLAARGAEVSARARPALWLRARRAGVEGPAVEGWRRHLATTAARHVVLSERLDRVARVLHGAGVEWVPIKGIDLARRLYDEPEERPTGDLDLLVAAGSLDRARKALTASGWLGLARGPRSESYLREEGYAWQARDDEGVLLELHYRLWSQVPEALAPALVAASRPSAGLPPGGRYLPWPEAWLVAAVHVWLDPPPRDIVTWWDLARLADRAPDELVERVPELARQWGLQLPVALAAEVSAELWNRTACRRIAADVGAELRRSERRLLESSPGRRVDTSLVAITVARFLARRPSRGRWTTPWRRLWAHPGVVERATPPSWSWPRRRLWYLLWSLGWLR